VRCRPPIKPRDNVNNTNAIISPIASQPSCSRAAVFRPSRDCSLGTLCGHGKGCIANDDNHLVGVAIGIVPLMVGIALMIYAYRFAPKERQ
jgi:hypothetical protein